MGVDLGGIADARGRKAEALRCGIEPDGSVRPAQGQPFAEGTTTRAEAEGMGWYTNWGTKRDTTRPGRITSGIRKRGDSGIPHPARIFSSWPTICNSIGQRANVSYGNE